MTIKELIEELQKYPPEMLVYIIDSEWESDPLHNLYIEKDVWVWDGPNHTIQDVLVLK